MAVPVQRDRTGEPVEPHLCRDGWLSPEGADVPVPCPECKPWLTHRRPPTRAELDAFRHRHPA